MKELQAAKGKAEHLTSSQNSLLRFMQVTPTNAGVS